MSQKNPAKCKDRRLIKELAGCKKGVKKCSLDNQAICLDDFPIQNWPKSSNSKSVNNIDNNSGNNEEKNNNNNKRDANNNKDSCLVYDFGIRKSPEYGLAFAEQNCTVVGFDPSPISTKWWKESSKRIREAYPTYDFVPLGAGGIDGDLELREYDWGQVSIIEFPTRVVDTTNCTDGGTCRYKYHDTQKTFTIPVRTLQTLMNHLNHTRNRIHLLKLDVEGSEYMFLEQMIEDLSCRKIDQLTLEWHHYAYDVRYGITSNPQLNVMVALLKQRCGLEQYWTHKSKGWQSNKKIYVEMGMTLYYTLASFKRTEWNWM